MKRTFAILCALVLCFSLSAQEKKTIVTYFSASGITKALATELAKEKKAELYEITPAKLYTDEDLDYRVQGCRSSKEMMDPKSRPELKEKKDLSKYDLIYVGYPIWWGVAPRIINTFIEQAKLDGKKVILFATSGSSSIDRSVEELKKAYPDILWQEPIPSKKARP